MSKFMSKKISKIYALCKNGKIIKRYTSYKRALRGFNSLYDNGLVLPDDYFSIINLEYNIFINCY